MTRKTGPIEWRIFGPPGTGKTTELGRRIRETCRKYGSASVIVMSFTRTAAIELVGRDLPLDRERVGTLHSFAFRALGRPEIAETRKWVKEWNLQAAEAFKLQSDQGRTADSPYEQIAEGSGRARSGDKLLSEYSRVRTRMLPLTACSEPAQQFARLWEAWKAEAGVLDFTDLIIKAYETRPLTPIPARILYADEVQDFSPLELALVRRWGESMDFIVLAGDDDQTIYSFRGSDPRVFIRGGEDRRKIVLPKSYRVPGKVKALADKWGRQLRHREPKDWSPRDEDGSVESVPVGLSSPGAIVERVARTTAGSSETVMVLASCGYLLEPLIRELRMRGIVYHNPYRPSHRAWNPVGRTAEAVLNYLCTDVRVHGQNAHSHTWRSVATWFRDLDAKAWKLRRGAKKMVKDRADSEDADQALKYEEFTDLGTEPPPRGDVNWLARRLLPRIRPRYSYALHVARKSAKKLFEKPQTIVGTVHSVKGGQADHVYLSPDLSEAGYLEWTSGDTDRKDSVRRLFYVGMTRARTKLWLLAPSHASRFVNWEGL